jgi:hypothetical protein
VQEFVHIHCLDLRKENTVENVKKMVSTVRQKAKELVIDGSKVFLRILDRNKGKGTLTSNFVDQRRIIHVKPSSGLEKGCFQ